MYVRSLDLYPFTNLHPKAKLRDIATKAKVDFTDSWANQAPDVVAKVCRVVSPSFLHYTHN